jgi:hypothetical protein
MQIGTVSRPCSVKRLTSFSAAGGGRSVGAVDALRDRLDLGVDRRVERVDGLERVRLLGRVDDRLGELAAPSPPSSNAELTGAQCAPSSSASRRTVATSSSVSPGSG